MTNWDKESWDKAREQRLIKERRRARNRRISAYVFGTVCLLLFFGGCTAVAWIPIHFIAKFW